MVLLGTWKGGQQKNDLQSVSRELQEPTKDGVVPWEQEEWAPSAGTHRVQWLEMAARQELWVSMWQLANPQPPGRGGAEGSGWGDLDLSHLPPRSSIGVSMEIRWQQSLLMCACGTMPQDTAQVEKSSTWFWKPPHRFSSAMQIFTAALSGILCSSLFISSEGLWSLCHINTASRFQSWSSKPQWICLHLMKRTEERKGYLPRELGSLPYLLFLFTQQVFSGSQRGFTLQASEMLEQASGACGGCRLLEENPLSMHSTCSNPKSSPGQTWKKDLCILWGLLDTTKRPRMD